MTDPAAALCAALSGLAVGSFLNVCIHRLPRGESVVAPPSRCPACRAPVRWFDNVPVLGYVVLGGRCRACRAPIGLQYPLVEVAAAALFAAQHQALGLQPLLAVRLLFTSALIVLFVVDLRHYVLPDAVTLPGIAVGLLCAIFLPPGWIDAGLGALAGGGVLWAIAEGYRRLRGREGMGFGDVKMLAMIGAFLGWPLVFVTLGWASILGATVGGAALWFAGSGWRRPLPFGSFLAVAAVAAALVGERFLAWYLDAATRLLGSIAGLP